jgi:hypothetical protein
MLFIKMIQETEIGASDGETLPKALCSVRSERGINK